jgi:hypothetical protein
MTNTRQPLPAKIELMLANAGVPPGGKLPLARIDAIFATQNYPIAKRLALKAELFQLGLIEV